MGDITMTAGIHSSTPATLSSGEALIKSTWMDGWLPSSHGVKHTIEYWKSFKTAVTVNVSQMFFADSSLPTVRRMAAKCSGWAQVLNLCCTHHFTKPGNIVVITKFQEIAAVFMLTILLHEHVNTVLRTAVIFCCKVSWQAWGPDSKTCQCRKKKKNKHI